MNMQVAEGEIRQAVIDAYFGYFKAYSERDWEGMTARFADNVAMIGTGVDEMTVDTRATLALFGREFGQAPAPMTHEVKRMEVFVVSETVALVVIEMDMTFHRPRMPVKKVRTTGPVPLWFWSMGPGRWRMDTGPSRMPTRMLEKACPAGCSRSETAGLRSSF